MRALTEHDFENYWFAGPRKRRLYAVACCRRIWPLLADARCRAAVEIAERYAEGSTGEEELNAAREKVAAVLDELGCYADMPFDSNGDPKVSAVMAVYEVVAPDEDLADVIYYECDRRVAEAETRLASRPGDYWSLWQEFFPSGRRVVNVDPKCQTTTVLELARRVYQHQAFDMMPLLAEALTAAGCKDARLLDHCRETRQHARGCWVLDALLQPERGTGAATR